MWQFLDLCIYWRTFHLFFLLQFASIQTGFGSCDTRRMIHVYVCLNSIYIFLSFPLQRVLFHKAAKMCNLI